MLRTDIAIVGGGLAGSMAAAMLGRAGIAAVLIDPHPVYPPDLRCEKLGGTQLPRLRRTGLADETLASTTVDGEVWEARFGYIVDRKPSDQHGVMYDSLVNTVRAAISHDIAFIRAKATAITTGDDRQTVTLSNGETVSARLVVLANGLNVGLRQALGIERLITSPCHSITLGFDIAPRDRTRFDFPALTYWPERTSDRMAYLTLFPIGRIMRANLMVYREMDDGWLRQVRQEPEATLRALMPNLRRMIGEFDVVGSLKIRPADLYVTKGHRQAGVVVIGDAFATSCPAAGTGTDKVFTDVERLCHVHIPAWLASDGMGADKIAAFYDDPEKVACDAWSTAKAHYLKSLTLDNGIYWRAQRGARFWLRFVQGTWRRLRNALGGGPELPPSQRRPAVVSRRRENRAA
jgi:2-polyprenyl-6-methoxyphenol hydroxylase-like FAD-dependent oxidoreductase